MTNSKLILPHRLLTLRRHSNVGFLWRATCLCGFYTLAASEEAVRDGFVSHIETEKPFDLSAFQSPSEN